jgi:hypothetical protein
MTDIAAPAADAAEESSQPPQVPEAPLPWHEFLANQGPPSKANVTCLGVQRPGYGGNAWWVAGPDIILHCPNEQCGGERVFASISGWESLSDKPNWIFRVYQCRNCRRYAKTYALIVKEEGEAPSDGVAVKVGEWPAFGPPVPSKLMSLVGPDRELFLQGRRAENHGLGIGAVAYYRRVVEDQKNRLLDEVIKVGEKTQVDPAVIEVLRAAKEETQFSRAMDDVKDAIPPVLRIDGMNPFTLLHSALSKNLHNSTDEECLAVATSIRIVLTEMSERIAQVLKDQAELKAAVKRLR